MKTVKAILRVQEVFLLYIKRYLPDFIEIYQWCSYSSYLCSYYIYILYIGIFYLFFKGFYKGVPTVPTYCINHIPPYTRSKKEKDKTCFLPLTYGVYVLQIM